MIKNIAINPALPYERCIVMVSRADTAEKARVARDWLKANTVINDDERLNLKLALDCMERMIQWKEYQKHYGLR